MKLSIYSAALLGVASCQTVNVFTTVETLYITSTQGQTGSLTTRAIGSSVISSYVVLPTATSKSSATFTSIPSQISSTSTKKSVSSSVTSASKTSSPSASSFSTKVSSSPVKSTSGTLSSSLSVPKGTPSATSSTITSSTGVSTSSSTLPSLTSATDYPSTGLYYHNIHRRNHSAPLVTWNSAQAVIAAEIASSCHFAHNMSVSGGGYGQNLAAYGSSGAVSSFSPSLMLAKSVTNQWYYGEVNSFLPSYYGEATPDMTYFESWGHFSQVVWKGSSNIGCASQFCPSGTIFSGFDSWFTVCNYVAPGNYIGSFGTNVFPALGQPATGPV